MRDIFIRGCGGECFYCGGNSPRQFLEGNVKYWACSEACIKEYKTEIMKVGNRG
jgi:hypothetical protein